MGLSFMGSWVWGLGVYGSRRLGVSGFRVYGFGSYGSMGLGLRSLG